jgi:osmotically inducible lipoprotein OsmB
MTMRYILIVSLVVGLTACGSMSKQERGTAIGAGVGGAVGAGVTGTTLGTVGGAVAGGIIGHEVEKDKK